MAAGSVATAFRADRVPHFGQRQGSKAADAREPVSTAEAIMLRSISLPLVCFGGSQKVKFRQVTWRDSGQLLLTGLADTRERAWVKSQA